MICFGMRKLDQILSLESNLSYLQHLIGKTCWTILKLRDEELHPQLFELSSRLMRMWRTMYECHQVQNNISQQVNRLSEYPSTEPTTAFHCMSTTQLEKEVNIWYNNFCNLVKSQREYIRVLNRWVQLAERLADDQPQIGLASNIHILCEEGQLAFDRLPEKVAAEAIKSFVSVIHSIVLQQTEEHNLQKKSDQLEKILEKEFNTLYEMEKKSKSSSTTDADPSFKYPYGIMARDFAHAYKQAFNNASKSGVAQETLQNVVHKVTKTMTEAEARPILGVSEQTPLEEILKVSALVFVATRSLPNLMETLTNYGAFGPVYKAKMGTGETVVVKVLAANSKQGENEFQSEVFRIEHNC